MDQYQTRLARLERQNRVMRTVLFSLMGAVGLAGLLRSIQDDGSAVGEVRARKLIIEDVEGNDRIVLEMKTKKLSKQKNEKRERELAQIFILDSEGDEHVGFDASDDGLSRYLLFGEDGDRRFEVATSVEDFAKLINYDARGWRVWNAWPN